MFEVLVAGVLLLIVFITASQVFINIYSSSISREGLLQYFEEENRINAASKIIQQDSLEDTGVEDLYEVNFERKKPLKIFIYKPEKK